MELDSIWPETLPWFQFEQSFHTSKSALGIIPTSNSTLYISKRSQVLQKSPGSLNALMTAFVSMTTEQEYQKNGSLWSLFPIYGDIGMLRKAIFDYSKLIPKNYQDTNQQTEGLAQVQDSDSIAMEILEVIFFHLSNNLWGNLAEFRQYDQFVLQLVEALSHSHPLMVASLLSDHGKTANAIKEAIYQSAIREKSYVIVSRLLEYGVDPELPVVCSHELLQESYCYLKRGKIQIRLSYSSSINRGLAIAAMTTDTRLGKILLDAKANANASEYHGLPPLELIGYHSDHQDNFDGALEFAHMLIEYGAEPNPSKRWNPRPRSPLDLAIARGDNLLVDFLIEQGANKILYARRGSDHYASEYWFSTQLRPFVSRLSPLLVAIVSGNNEVIEKLLQPVLSQHTRVSLEFIRDIFITACLAGDAAVVSRLLKYLNIDLDQDWVDGITPLVATAWNPDTTIARLLLAAGANFGPKRSNDDRHATTQIKVPTPMHVAAFHGNAELVKLLIDRGASCNVPLLYNNPENTAHTDGCYINWLLPFGLSSPLHLALQSEDSETATLLLSHSELIGGELAHAVKLGDTTIITELVSKGGDILYVNEDGITALEAAAEKGNSEIISLFFASGGKYRSSALFRATYSAIHSRDFSLVTNLMGHRPSGPIDRHEASCLVLALEEGEWDDVRQFLNSFTPGPSPSFYFLGYYESKRKLEMKHNFHEYDLDSRFGITPLWAAYLSGNIPIIQGMLQQGYSLHSYDLNSFSRSVIEHDDERSKSISRLLLSTSHFESMNRSGRQMILLCAIRSYDLDKTRVRKYIRLIDTLNFTIGHKTGAARTPLILAVQMNRSELINELIDAGADVNYIDYDGDMRIPTDSAFEEAVTKGLLEIVQSLIARGANINKPAAPFFGRTALQLAARLGHIRIVKTLIDHGADINAPPAKYGGLTTLEGAAECGRLDTVKLLLELGADLGDKMRIYYVRSVLFARRGGFYALASLLINHGSWTEEDQILYDHPSTRQRDGYFRYDKQEQDWHFRQMDLDINHEFHSVGSSSISSAEYSTCDSSSGEEDETGDADWRGLAVDEAESEIDDWLHTVVDTFDTSAGFNAPEQEGPSNPLALPLRPSDRITTEPNSPEQLSDEDGEPEMMEFAGIDLEQGRGGQQDGLVFETTAGEQQINVAREQEFALQIETMPQLVDEQALTTDIGPMPWSDPFFGADAIEDMWDI